MKKAFVLISFLLLTVSTFKCLAQDNRFKSLYIYNFTKYIEWPNELRTGDFIITIVGASPLYKDLILLGTHKTVGTQKIKVSKVATLDEVKDCHLLYLTTSNSNMLDAALAKFSSKPILIVTDKPGLIDKGASINYVEIGGKLKFEISKKNIEAHNLKVSSVLIGYGIPK